MDISVVVPCYNAERFIGASLASIAAQTRPPREVIVVDDGSSDGSIEAVRSSQLPLRLLQTSRCGAAGARNVGIDAAEGDWLAFLDADDLWYPNHLERGAEIVGRSDAVAYINHYDRLASTGDDIRPRACPVDAVVEGSGLDDYIQLFIRYRHFVGMSACFVATERARAVGGLQLDQVRRNDIEFWLRVVNGERWVFDPVATSAYRKNTPGGLSSESADAAFDGFRAFLRHRDEARNRPAFDTVLRERARSAIAWSFASGDEARRERAYRVAYDHLGNLHKLVFGLSHRFPALFPAFRALKLT
jgi:glycosyltransferase involved in cell wall biosynthesis